MSLKLKFFIYLIFPLYCAIESHALVVESPEISDVFKYSEKDALIVFDIDNTLIESVYHLGSDQWFDHTTQEFIKLGSDRNEAVEKAYQKWMTILPKTKMQLVDPNAPQLLKKMRSNGFYMMGMTKRDPELSQLTIDLLARFEIDFAKTAPLAEAATFSSIGQTIYKNGIVFIAGGYNKKSSLIEYLKALPQMPKKIVCIDDKLRHIKDMEEAAASLGVPYVGIRYSKTDPKVESYNHQIAEIQWEYCHEIIPDEDAAQLLKK